MCAFSPEQTGFLRMWKNNHVMSFKLSEKLVASTVSSAVLHVHVGSEEAEGGGVGGRGGRGLGESESETAATVYVKAFRVQRSEGGASTGSLAGAATVSLNAPQPQGRSGQWVSLDVAPALRAWLQLPRADLELAVRAIDRGRRYQVPPIGPDSADKQPYLEINIEDDSRRRTKRSLGLKCDENSSETRCCRYPLMVDFESFGWDWIIAPKSYEANYCMGECPYAYMQKFPVTHVVHLAAPPGYRGPCCSPKKLTSIRLLHFDHDFNIKLGTIPAMIVEKCGCS